MDNTLTEKDRIIVKEIINDLHNMTYEDRYRRLQNMGYSMLHIDGIDINEKRKERDEQLKRVDAKFDELLK